MKENKCGSKRRLFLAYANIIRIVKDHELEPLKPAVIDCSNEKQETITNYIRFEMPVPTIGIMKIAESFCIKAFASYLLKDLRQMLKNVKASH